MFHCYTECSCSFNVFDLVMKAKLQQGYDISFPEAIRYVADIADIRSTGHQEVKSSHIIDDWKWINRFTKKEKKEIKLNTYDPTVMEVFLPYPHESWIKEGISYETQEKFNIGFYAKDQRIVVPHFNISGGIVGIRGRATLQEDIDNGKKYMPLFINGNLLNHPTMFNLYGLHKTVNAIRRLGKVMIYEGEKSVLKCEDFYGDDNFTVAVGGGSISRWHVQTLLSLGVKEVFIAFDKQFNPNDEENMTELEKIKMYKYMESIRKLAEKFTPYCRTYILWDNQDLLELKDSPCDKGKEVLEQLMKAKIEIKTIEEEVID
jgi:hypothetical protein